MIRTALILLALTAAAFASDGTVNLKSTTPLSKTKWHATPPKRAVAPSAAPPATVATVAPGQYMVMQIVPCGTATCLSVMSNMGVTASVPPSCPKMETLVFDTNSAPWCVPNGRMVAPQ